MSVDSIPFFEMELSLADDKEMTEAARKLLRRLRPLWSDKNVCFEIFTAGITNKTFCAKHECKNGVLKEEKIIIRVFGRNTERIINRKDEITNWLLLAANRCAAPIYATFRNGIACGYAPGEPLSVKSVRDPAIVPKICKMLSKIHKIKSTEEDSPKPLLFDKIEKFLTNFSYTFSDSKKQVQFDEFMKKNQVSFGDDLVSLRRIISGLDSKVVFCHNDLLVHNILFDRKSEQVFFIDYEYAGFNYQDFDIANHFCEYAGVDGADFSLCPSKEQKKQWIHKYMQYFLEREPEDAEVDRMLEKNDIFEAASHFFWSIWALVQSQNSNIDFDYLSYALLRYEIFQTKMRAYEMSF